jgi:hypothetical protein
MSGSVVRTYEAYFEAEGHHFKTSVNEGKLYCSGCRLPSIKIENLFCVHFVLLTVVTGTEYYAHACYTIESRC